MLVCQTSWDTNTIKKRLLEILAHPDDVVYVACLDDQVKGWVHGFYSRRVESDSFVEIGGLVVDAHYRNRSIGRLLVDEILEWARTKGCEKVRVRTNTIREEAHQFYLKRGFLLNKEQKIFDKLLY